LLLDGLIFKVNDIEKQFALGETNGSKGI